MNLGTRARVRSVTLRVRRSEKTDWVLIGVAIAATALVLLGDLRGLGGVAAIGIGTGAATWVGTRETLRVPRWVPWAGMMLVAVIAVARAPMGSHDMWAYASYGRLVEHYHVDPYHVVIAHFPRDPVVQMVGRGWWHTPSAYGPLFVGVAAGVSRLAGTHLLFVRLGFQVPVALALFTCVWIVARSTQRRAVVVLVGLQPMVWIAVVNGAHADVYVALGAVAAVALLRRDRILGAALVIGLAALVKIAALFAVPVIAVVLLTQRGVRDAFRFTAGVGALMLVGLAIAPSSFTSAADATHGIISRASPWRLVVHAGVVSAGVASTLGLIAATLIIAEIARRYRHTSDLAVPIALALATYAIVAGFTLPWYALWSMPVAAMVSTRRDIAAVTALHGGILLAAYQAGSSSESARIGGGVLTNIFPAVTVAVLLVLVLRRQPTSRIPGDGDLARLLGRLRRVDVDPPPGQFGAELVQDGERRV